jgi:hypothetical protein
MAKTPSLNASVRLVLTVLPLLYRSSFHARREAYATGESRIATSPEWLGSFASSLLYTKLPALSEP